MSGTLHALHQKAADLAARYAQNRADLNLLNKQIDVLTDWQRPDKGVDLSSVRTEYLEEGDRWRGWAWAIEVIEGFRDAETLTPITDDQRALAALLDQKAALRVQAGNIKRGIVSVGRQLQKAKP
jgi:hypothetical protein